MPKNDESIIWRVDGSSRMFLYKGMWYDASDYEVITGKKMRHHIVNPLTGDSHVVEVTPEEHKELHGTTKKERWDKFKDSLNSIGEKKPTKAQKTRQMNIDKFKKMLANNPSRGDEVDRRKEFVNKPWQQGRVLHTRTTKAWPDEKWREENIREQCCAFVNFGTKDSGRSRELVFKYNSPRECEVAVENHNKLLYRRKKGYLAPEYWK